MIKSGKKFSSKKELLLSLLHEGAFRLGEILLRADWSLRHYDDRSFLEEELKLYTQPQDARQISRYDLQGKIRPLKTAPNLLRGWLLKLKSLEEVLLALDFFYPAALDLYRTFLAGELSSTPLRSTLNRQTGMYRITQLLTDEQAQELIGQMCCSDHGCLRKVLWSIAPDEEMTTLPLEKTRVDQNNNSSSLQEIPLLCREACNLLVAAARPLAKKNLPSS